MRGYGGSSLLELTHNRWSFTQPCQERREDLVFALKIKAVFKKNDAPISMKPERLLSKTPKRGLKSQLLTDLRHNDILEIKLHTLEGKCSKIPLFCTSSWHARAWS